MYIFYHVTKTVKKKISAKYQVNLYVRGRSHQSVVNHPNNNTVLPLNMK